MRKLGLPFLLILFAALPAFAQTTTVTGTITDPGGLPYAGATLKAQLVLAGAGLTGQATVTVNNTQQCRSAGQGSAPCQIPFQGTQGPVTLDSGGNIPSGGLNLQDNTQVTPAGTQWLFSVTIAPGIPPPAGNGPQSCFATVTITGATQSITSAFSCPLLAKPVTPGAVGSPGQTITNNNGVLAGTPCETFKNNATGPVNVNCDWHPVGPNPFVDITVPPFNARTVNPNIAPAALGITANCTATLFTCTLSSASTFQTNDGVVVFGAGAPHSMSTPTAPTVTPVLAQVGTHTLITTASAPVGATTYNYYIMARDRNGGLTALGPVGSTTTGASSLGAQTVNITSFSRSGQVNTVTVGSHGFLVGCDGSNPNCGEIFIGGGNGLTDPTFRGWFNVNNVSNGTTFSFAAPPDTALGASTSATGGTVTWYNANKVTWAPVTPANSAVYYGVYSDRAVAGTCALIGVSNALSSSGTQDLEYDDFGSPFEDNQVFPFIFPLSFPCASPPAATSDSLSTTISAGGGTTTLTLANAVGTTVTAAPILFDDAPNILAAAATIANKQGALLIPCDGSGRQFVINSWLQLNGNNYGIAHCGPLWVNDTIEVAGTGNNGTRWVGQYRAFPSAFGSSPSAQWSNFPQIFVNAAHPALYFSGLQFGLHVEGINFGTNVGNGTTDILADGGFNQTFEWINFGSGSGGNDFTSMGLQLRTNPGQNNSNVSLDYIGFSVGGGGDGTSHTPTFLCRTCGTVSVQRSYSIHRGMADLGTGTIELGVGGVAYINGGGTPLLTMLDTNTAVLGQIIMDTIAQPCVSALHNGGTSNSFIVFQNGCTPSSSVLPVSGGITGSALVPSVPFVLGLYQPTFRRANGLGVASSYDNLTEPIGGNYPLNDFNQGIAVGPSYSFFVNGVIPSLNTCPVSAGGTLSVATHTYNIVPDWWSGASGNKSFTCSATTTSGNQTVTLNWTLIPGNPKGIEVYRDLGNINTGGGCGVLLAGNTTTFVDNGAAACGTRILPSIPSGGPTMLMPGNQGLSTDRLTINGNCSSSASPAVCGTSASGSVAIAAGATTLTVNTTAVTANSQILVVNDDSLGAKLGVTCNTTINNIWVSARTPGTSFQITVAAAPVTNPECVSYSIQN